MLANDITIVEVFTNHTDTVARLHLINLAICYECTHILWWLCDDKGQDCYLAFYNCWSFFCRNTGTGEGKSQPLVSSSDSISSTAGALLSFIKSGNPYRFMATSAYLWLYSPLSTKTESKDCTCVSCGWCFLFTTLLPQSLSIRVFHTMPRFAETLSLRNLLKRVTSSEYWANQEQ